MMKIEPSSVIERAAGLAGSRLRLVAAAAAAVAGAALPLHTARGQAQNPTCVDVQVGSAASYACLNQRLQAFSKAASETAHAPQAPYDANSPSNVTGQFNESATRNRLGDNFGHSVTPERPASAFPHGAR